MEEETNSKNVNQENIKKENVKPEKKQMDPKVKNIIEWGYCILIAIVLAILFKFFIGTPTMVQQPSMNYTLEEGQRLFLSRWTRTIKGTYNRGDIVTFEAPKSQLSAYEINQENPVAIYENQPEGIFKKFSYYVLEIDKVSYIKRVIGIAGDHIKIEDGKVYLNDEELNEPYIREGVTTQKDNFSDIVVPEGCVFVMGDNRSQSTDSRDFGCIPLEKVESKVVLRFWPLTKFGKVK